MSGPHPQPATALRRGPPDLDQLPSCSFGDGALHHIGTLDRADKGCGGPSHEGDGLSVSTHPDAWEAIARLGGRPWWRLHRDGNRILDAHALTAAQRVELSGWAVAAGLAVWTAAWRVSWHDEDLGEQRMSPARTSRSSSVTTTATSPARSPSTWTPSPDTDLEGVIDLLSEALTGSPLLIDVAWKVVGHDGDTLRLLVTGDPSEIAAQADPDE